MKRVTLKIHFEDLFQKEMPAELRRQRWEEWKALCRKSPHPELVDEWTTPNGSCNVCDQRDNDWCHLQELPVTVNPIFSFQNGIPGFACCGAYEVPVQTELDLENSTDCPV